MAAQREGMTFSSVRVEIEQDWDNRGVLAMPGAPAGPLATRLSVQIGSTEPLETVQALVGRTFANDPWVLCFRDAQKLELDVSTNHTSS
jgi:hypothetical protein